MESDVKSGAARIGDVLIRQSPSTVEVTLNRPAKINALNDGLVEGLEHAIEAAENGGAILLVIRGAGGNFCAGADLKYVSTLFADLETGLFPYIARLRRICDALAGGPFISLALIEGYALAGGYEILTACDLAVATTSAQIGDRHLEYALAPGLGASVRIAQHMSSKRTHYLAFTGEMISGAQAAEWGLVSHAWAAEEFEQRAAALMARLASRSAASVRSYKQMLLAGERSSFQDALRFEESAFRAYQRGSSEAREGVGRFTAAGAGGTPPVSS
jgi:enoyl-CoA hydratase/carnithine racemase